MRIVKVPGTYPVALFHEHERDELVARLRDKCSKDTPAQALRDMVDDIADRAEAIAAAPSWSARKGATHMTFVHLLPVGSRESAVELTFELDI